MITAIYNNIGSSRIAGRVTGQKEISTLQLRSLALSPHGDLVLPDVLGHLWHEVADLGCHIARRNGVRPRELHPLDRQAPAQMNDTGFGGIVGCLQLRDIDDVARHGCGGDERAALEAFEPILFLLAPDGSAGPGAVEGAVKVGGDDFLVMIKPSIDHGALSPGDAGVGDKDVKAIVEFGDLGSDGLVDLGRVLDVDLVRFACRLKKWLGHGAGWYGA